MAKSVRVLDAPVKSVKKVVKEVEQPKVDPSERITKIISEVRNIDLDILETSEVLKKAKAKRDPLIVELEAFALQMFPNKDGQKRFGDGLIGFKAGSEAVKVEGDEKELILLIESEKRKEFLNTSVSLDRKKITEFLKLGKIDATNKEFIYLTKNGISLAKTPKFFVE